MLLSDKPAQSDIKVIFSQEGMILDTLSVQAEMRCSQASGKRTTAQLQGAG